MIIAAYLKDVTIKIYQEDRNQIKTETNGTRVWFKTRDFLQQKVGFCIICSSLVEYLAVVEGLLFLAVGMRFSGHYRCVEVAVVERLK